MLTLQEYTKIENDDDLLLPYKCNSVFFLHPSRMKLLDIVKDSYVLVHTKKGQLILKCWPCRTIDTTNAALYSKLFLYYVESPVVIQPVQLFASPAKVIYLYPESYRNFMNTPQFLSFLLTELSEVYIREELVISVTYLGYSCFLTIKNINSTFCENSNSNCDQKDSSKEISTFFSQMSLNSPKTSANQNIDLFIEDFKNAQTSTPISSRKSKNQNSSEIVSNFQTQPSPENFFYLNSKTEIIFKQKECEPNRKQKECELERRFHFEDIIGLDETINYIKSAIHSIIQPRVGILTLFTSGILLCGPSDSGKSMIGEVLTNEYNIPVYFIRFKSTKSFELKDLIKLEELVKEADKGSSSILYLDDLDYLFSKVAQSNYLLEKESFLKRITLIMYHTLNYCRNILVIATVENKSLLPPKFRKSGFFVKEFQLSLLASDRKQIILKILQEYSHFLSENEVEEITELTNGFSGGELCRLCEKSKASISKNTLKKCELFSIIVNYIKKNAKHLTASTKFNFETPNVRWEDIGGMKEVKHAIMEMIDWPLRLSHKFKLFQIKPPRGILMYGPPGCCKTMIAKALVTECKLNFISVKGCELFNKYVGESEKSVSELFKRARAAAPCVLFFDEIDSMTSTRGSTSGNSNVCDRILTQLLIEIDGIDTLEGVSILAATNRPDIIDPSFLRPGRFDHTLYVPLPDNLTRKEIFKIKLQKLPISSDVDISYLVYATEGYSGAEITEVCQEAVKYIIKEDISSTTSIINMKHFLKALQVVQAKTTEEMKTFFTKYEKRNYFHCKK